MNADRGSISNLIDALKQGESLALEDLWDRMIIEAIPMAKGQLVGRGGKRRVTDEEDLAHMALQSLLLGARGGEFPELSDRQGLFRLLREIIRCRAINLVRDERAEKRGGGKVRGDSLFDVGTDGSRAPGLQNQAGIAPGPVDFDDVVSLVRNQFESLNDDLLQLVLLRFAGFTNPEIASMLNLSLATTERRMSAIRMEWERQSLQDLAESIAAGDVATRDLCPNLSDCESLCETSEMVAKTLVHVEAHFNQLTGQISARLREDKASVTTCSLTVSDLRKGRTNDMPASYQLASSHMRPGTRIWGLLIQSDVADDRALVHCFAHTRSRWVLIPEWNRMFESLAQ